MIPYGSEPRPSADQLCDQRLARCVDSGGGVLLRRADDTKELFGCPPSVGVEGRPTREEHRNRFGPVLVDDGAKCGGYIADGLGPFLSLPAVARGEAACRDGEGRGGTHRAHEPLGTRSPATVGAARSPRTWTTRSSSTVTTMPHIALQMRQNDVISRVPTIAMLPHASRAAPGTLEKCS